MRHAQDGRIEEQRCSLQPSGTPGTPTYNENAFFKFIASSQGRRLDDQRVTLPSLPGIIGNPNGQSGSPTALPKSSSFSPQTEYQKQLNSPGQVTYSFIFSLI
uniref:Uncharacterized protein n=1 Tax=Gasterosteus aculeatus aculeatus TaxID=481459 RepID=A0AAQ4PU65_GASAC